MDLSEIISNSDKILIYADSQDSVAMKNATILYNNIDMYHKDKNFDKCVIKNLQELLTYRQMLVETYLHLLFVKPGTLLMARCDLMLTVIKNDVIVTKHRYGQSIDRMININDFILHYRKNKINKIISKIYEKRTTRNFIKKVSRFLRLGKN
jgi:hypothetical protein